MGCGDWHHIPAARPALLEARELSITHRPVEVRLTFFERVRAIGRGHRLLAHLSIIQGLDVHSAMLTGSAALKTGQLDGVPMRDRAD